MLIKDSFSYNKSELECFITKANQIQEVPDLLQWPIFDLEIIRTLKIILNPYMVTTMDQHN